MLQTTHYQHSGKAPLPGILLTLFSGLAASVVLGAIYGFLIYWIPFVYINFFVTLGLGVGLAMAVGFAGKAGRIRNNKVIGILGLLAALVAYVVHWSVWVGRMTDSGFVAPGELWTYIQFINAIGPWSIFGWTPSGFSLWVIWGIEAIMIFGVGAIAAQGFTDAPYCEATGQWTTVRTLPMQFAVPDDVQQAASPASLLQVLQPAAEPTNTYTEVSIATAEGSELRCVSLDSIVVEVDKEGKEDKKKKPLVRNMLFDRDSFEKLLQLAGPTTA